MWVSENNKCAFIVHLNHTLDLIHFQPLDLGEGEKSSRFWEKEKRGKSETHSFHCEKRSVREPRRVFNWKRRLQQRNDSISKEKLSMNFEKKVAFITTIHSPYNTDFYQPYSRKVHNFRGFWLAGNSIQVCTVTVQLC